MNIKKRVGSKHSVYYRTVLYFSIIAIVFGCASLLWFKDTRSDYIVEQGIIDPSSIDLETEIMTFDSHVEYKGAFYSSQDFQNGVVTPETDTSEEGFGTVRYLIKLPKDKMYAISARSISYAQRMYINGKEYSSIGTPASTKEEAVPKTNRYTEVFYTDSDVTEILFHYSNLVHSDTGGIFDIDIGAPKLIIQNEKLRVIQDFFIAAVIIMASLCFLGLFIFFSERRQFLWFSLSCLFIALRNLFVVNKSIMVILPDLDWYTAIRLEYILNSLIALCACHYIFTFLKPASNRIILRILDGLLVAIVIFIIVTPPIVFTAYVTTFYVLYIIISLYVGYSIGKEYWNKKKEAKLDTIPSEYTLLILGFIVFIIFGVLEMYSFQYAGSIRNINYLQIGMMIFLFINIIALVLGFVRVEKELTLTRRIELETKQKIQMLEHLEVAKNEFLSTVSHEMKTPLTIMSNGAGLALHQIRKNTLSDSAEERLEVIQHEAVRLGKLVEQVMMFSIDKQWEYTLTKTNAKELLEKAATFCQPICRGKDNEIKVDSDPDAIFVNVNVESIFQVLINLITNANKHVRNDVIRLSVRKQDTMAVFEVADEGTGIPEDLIDSIFERGVSGDASTGLGLYICKEIIKEHKGEIWVQKEREKGTSILFTLPYEKVGEVDA